MNWASRARRAERYFWTYKGEITLKVIVTDDRHGSYDVEKSVLDSIGAELIVENCVTSDEVLSACRDADAVLCNLAPMPSSVIDGLNSCKVISRYGVGYDNVDVSACTSKGILLCNVPDYCTEEVSDHALALLMACARRVARRDFQVRSGMWNICRKEPIYRIAGKTIAFLGYGKIARCLHRKTIGLEFKRTLIYDPYIEKSLIAGMGGIESDWKTIFSEADFISVHLPLNDHTRQIIGEAEFGMMKSTAVLINTSRGAVIDESAMVKSLSESKILAAGLDTFETEPLPIDSPLRSLENCVLTDHVGFYSEESLEELKQKAAENICDFFKGKNPKYPVNLSVK